MNRALEKWVIHAQLLSPVAQLLPASSQMGDVRYEYGVLYFSGPHSSILSFDALIRAEDDGLHSQSALTCSKLLGEVTRIAGRDFVVTKRQSERRQGDKISKEFLLKASVCDTKCGVEIRAWTGLKCNVSIVPRRTMQACSICSELGHSWTTCCGRPGLCRIALTWPNFVIPTNDEEIFAE